MPISAKIRMPLDIAMTVATLVLMGGNGLFYSAFDGAVDSGLVHEVLGVVLFVLWAVHVVLNRAWVKAVLKGKYNALRIVRTIINAGVIVCVLFLMVSGVMLSTHVFAWLGIESGASFARNAHMLASHWYLVFVSLHIGLHLSLFIRGRVATGITFALAAYGIYAFAARGLWKYLTLQQPFFFLDLERGYLLFALDYIAIMALFAMAMSLAMKAMVYNSR
ncbi:DUF4405 domain-containing protein [uncultured Fibrobacter sp.]|uniref:DUF4405 domain-containing protein n=1 Tax=uncultured Fibrobacter sp. TaxID=261512 RepID=UPI0025E08BD5|nr:DUF4405 domain-containing protein [uncultured Fibrobacter sp.]